MPHRREQGLHGTAPASRYCTGLRIHGCEGNHRIRARSQGQHSCQQQSLVREHPETALLDASFSCPGSPLMLRQSNSLSQPSTTFPQQLSPLYFKPAPSVLRPAIVSPFFISSTILREPH